MRRRYLIIIIVILITLMGCIEGNNYPSRNTYSLNYSTEWTIQNSWNGTYHGIHQSSSFFYTFFSIGENISTIKITTQWNTHRTQQNTGPYLDFEYSVKLKAPIPKIITCNPSNETINRTDMILLRGQIQIICNLNDIPLNSTVKGQNINDVSQTIESGLVGFGVWNYSMDIKPKQSDPLVYILSDWNITLSTEQYFLTITKN